MSVFIKKSKLRVKNEDGTSYTGVMNAIAEESTEELIKQIEPKGKKTLESVPEDYTVLEEKVDKLKEEMANVKSITDAIDERILEAFFGSMRNGKVYQSEVYLTQTNPTSDGVKTLANANMVCEPSTDTVEGRDDYEALEFSTGINATTLQMITVARFRQQSRDGETVIRMMDLLTLVLLQ